GFEPTTLCPPGRCATRLRYAPTCIAMSALAERAASIAARSWEWGMGAEATGTIPDSPLPVCGLSAPQQLQHFFQLHPHLLDDLPRQRRFVLGRFAFQPQARAADGVALFVQQAADLPHHQHFVALVVAAVAAALDRVEGRKLGFPIPQHVRLDVAQLADLTD